MSEQCDASRRREQVDLVLGADDIGVHRCQRGGGRAHHRLRDTADHAAMKNTVLLTDVRAVVDPKYRFSGIDAGESNTDQPQETLSTDVALDESTKIWIARLKMSQYRGLSRCERVTDTTSFSQTGSPHATASEGYFCMRRRACVRPSHVHS